MENYIPMKYQNLSKEDFGITQRRDFASVLMPLELGRVRKDEDASGATHKC
jgi:hypothetical protein